MRIVLFCENKYAVDILYPIYQEAINAGDNHLLWYVHLPKIPAFPLKDEVSYTHSMQAVYDFSPEAIFVPGNIVPYYLPGVKIQVFHGYAAEKKDHWIIRRYFDTYFTQGPFFTKKFKELSAKYGDFEVVETGWPKQDWIKTHWHDFDGERDELLKKHGKKQIVLYAPTFSLSLTSLPALKEALVHLTKTKDIVLLLKFHPLTRQEWIDEYRQLAEKEEHIVWVDDINVTKYQLMSDLMISDTSSTVYEFLLLGRPVITYRTIAKDVYWTDITDISQLPEAFESAQYNEEGIAKRCWIVENYDPYLDGKVCRRMLDATADYIRRHGVPEERKLNLWRKYTSIKKFGRIHKKERVKNNNLMKLNMKSYVFPGNIEDSILQIGGKPFPYMRTEQFSELVKDSEKMLLQLINCPEGRVIFYTASGTGAMDAVVTNYVSTCKKALIVAGGSFGYRWKSLCDYYNCPNEVFEVPFARDIDYALLEEKVRIVQPDVFLCQHHETSTGQLYNMEKISSICKKYNVSLVVDAISSFLSDELDMDALDIDICITSSQKGLNIAPGLSFLFLSPKVLQKDFGNKSYYFDFKENLRNLERGQTPYSPATTLFLQLHARLQNDISIGVKNIVASVREKALYFRKLCKENGWEVPAEVPSNCITGFFVRKNGDILFKELLKQDIFIMPGGTPNYFRVSHLGVQTPADLEELANRIKEIENRKSI